MLRQKGQQMGESGRDDKLRREWIKALLNLDSVVKPVINGTNMRDLYLPISVGLLFGT